MIIDCHTHIGRYPGQKNFTAKDLLCSMDEAGIDVSLVIANDWMGEKHGTDIEELLGVAQTHPRLKAIGDVRYSEPLAPQIDHLRQLLLKKRIVGVKMYLGYESFYPNDEKLHPLYEFCSEHGFPIMFHTGFLAEALSGKLKYAHPLLIDDVAVDFPNLKIVIAHIGNPWIMDCAMVVGKNRNVYTDLSGFFSEFESISPKEQKEFAEAMHIFSVTAGGLSKCLFGTDYPLYSQKEYLEAVRSLPFTEEEHKRVFLQNAQKVFEL